MDRRTFIAAAPAMATARPASATKAAEGLPLEAWALLRQRLGSRLISVQSPLQACADAGGTGADVLFKQVKNPYFLSDEPGLTQTFGWIDAWTSQASSHAIAAETAQDVAEAVRFARQHSLRIVVKGGGHSYFGNSNAAGSLLIWTKRMDTVTLHDGFVGHGWPADAEPVPAASIGAGALWGRVYRKVAVEGGRYIQGGGCLTVGVAGFVQGGGFGSLSKAFGTGAANLLEAEVVTAEGEVRIANAHSEPELFFALQGGGGGTFGIVTRLTMRTDPLPATIGGVMLSVTAHSDKAWRDLVAWMMRFYAEALFNPIWGEQIRFSPGRRMSVLMVFQGLNEQQARATWQPMFSWLRDRAQDYELNQEPLVLTLSGREFWDAAFLRTLPGLVLPDDRPGAADTDVFWASNRDEAGQVLHAYQSAWLPATLLQPLRQQAMVEALVAASAEWSVTLHTNKGLAGGSREALEMTGQTATNPAVLDAFALLICAAAGPAAWPGIPGYEPNAALARHQAQRVARAMEPIRQLVPQAGTYMSETDYFGQDWQQAYWGRHYARLRAAKRQYDPEGIFQGHHAVEA